MSILGPMAALGGHLIVCPHNPCWKWPRSDGTEIAASGILSISNPKSQLRRFRDGQSVARRKCMAGQAKVLDADGNLKTTDSDDGASRDSNASAIESGGGNGTTNKFENSSPAAGTQKDAESIPLLKPSPRPVAPLVRPKPVIQQPPLIQQPPARPKPVMAQPQNGPLTSRNPQGTPGVQRLDRTFQNAERINSRPAMGRQQSFQQPGFQTKWRKGDSSTPVNRGNGAVGSRPPEARPSQAPSENSLPKATTQAGSPVTLPMSRVTGPSAQPAPVSKNMSAPSATPVTPSTPPDSVSSVPSEPRVSVASTPSVADSTSSIPSASAGSKSSVPFTASAPIRPAPPPIRPPVRPAAPPVRPAAPPVRPAPPRPGAPVSRVSPPPPGRTAGPRLIDAWRRPQPVVETKQPVSGASQIEIGRQPVVEEKKEAEERPPPVTSDEQPLMMDRIASVRMPKDNQATADADAGTNVSDTLRPQVPNASPPQARSPRLNSPPIVRPQPGLRQQQQPQMASRPIMSRKPVMAPKPASQVEDAIDPVAVPEVDTRSPRGRPSKVVKDKVKRRFKKDEEGGDDAATIRTSRKYLRAKRKAMRAAARAAAAPVKVEILEVGKEGMSVGTLAQNLVVTKEEIVNFLASKGIPVGINQTLDEECVKIVCNQYDVEVLEAIPMKVEELAKKEQEFIDEEDLDSLEPRPPVITVMGHVDHGKTSLLDYIRKTRVAAREAGGITQAIGAYQVPVNLEDETEMCVFLDTPGHEAFSAMRARGARVTDIAVIVVAADDGPRPQTLEAIAHARAAKVPLIVAINKIDKPGVDVDRVKEELSKAGLVPPEWGGEDQMVLVSAVTGEGIDVLLETIMLVAEIQELRANPNRTAKGTVIEATLRKTKGPVATLLVQNGTLKKGDVVLSGETYGRVRALYNDQGALVNEAGPSVPVQVIGLSTVPIPGDTFEVREGIDDAREAAAENSERLKEARLAAQASENKVTLAALATAVASGEEIGVEARQLNVVLKVDVQGSVEAIREALQVLPQDTVNLRFLLQATGDIATSDVDLALASGAIIVGFNVRVQPGVKTDRVEVRLYKVIYELVDDMRQAMEGLLKPKEEEEPIGMAEVRAVFSSGSLKVAGCLVTEGKLVKGCGVHIERNGKRLHTGTLDSLRRVKEVAKQVEAGLECGVGVSSFNDWEEGYTIQAFRKVEKKRTLEDASATVAATLAAGGEVLYEKNTETEEPSETTPDRPYNNNSNKKSKNNDKRSKQQRKR